MIDYQLALDLWRAMTSAWEGGNEETIRAAIDSARGGWIIGSGDGKRFRAWESGMPEWTDDRHYANHYLVDEAEDASLCIDETQHKAVVALFDALAIRNPETR